MTPVFQTRTGANLGNCTEACIATVLSLKLSDVPDLCEGGVRRPDWAATLSDWLRARGLVAVAAYTESQQSWPFSWQDIPDGVYSVMRRRPILIGGMNPDNLGHYVAFWQGHAHDPNPSQRFLATWEEVRCYMPIDEARNLWGNLADARAIQLEWR